MKKYIVTGYANVVVEVTVEAENEEEAIEKAYDNVGVDVDNYCGNGGVDKLIGVCNTDEVTASIYADSELDYVEVEEIE